MHIVIDLDITKDKGIIKSDSLDQIREAFSEADPQANIKKYIFKKSARYIPTRKYIITEAGRFSLGLLPNIILYLKSLETPFRIVLTEEFKRRYATAYPFSDQPLKELNYKLHGFQEIGVKRAIKNGCGLAIEPTGAGKTLMQASIIETVRQNNPETKTLLITMTHLIDQVYQEFIKYGIDPKIISKWSGSEKLDQNAKIIICGTNILYSKIDNIPLELKKVKIVYLTMKKTLENATNMSNDARKTLENKILEAQRDMANLEKRLIINEEIYDFLRSIDLLIVDEVHGWKKTGEIVNVLKYINTRNRFGFTGTLPEMKIDEWTIIGEFGPIIHESKREELVADKHITDTDVRILVLEHKTQPEPIIEDAIDENGDEEKESRYLKELEFIHKNIFRNNVIKKIAEKTTKNTLILIDRLEHGDILYDYLKTNIKDKQVFYIKGEVEDEERLKIIEIMEKENNIVCIAVSKIFSTGVNIRNLHHIIFTSAGKAKVKNIQSIGRGVRKLEGKDKVVIWDISDNLYYSEKHLKQRTTVYDNDKISYKITKIKEN